MYIGEAAWLVKNGMGPERRFANILVNIILSTVKAKKVVLEQFAV